MSNHFLLPQNPFVDFANWSLQNPGLTSAAGGGGWTDCLLVVVVVVV